MYRNSNLYKDVLSVTKELSLIVLRQPRLYVPLTPWEKRKYLEKAENAVSKYKPLIEERTGVDLGEISVRDFKYYFENAFRNDPELSDLLKDTTGKIVFKALNAPTSFVMGALRGMMYNNQAIYISMGLTTRGVMVFGHHDEYIEEVVVHELSHALWNSLGGANLGTLDNKKDNKDLKKWNEGFSNYCQSVAFDDFYPEGHYAPLIRRKKDTRDIEEIIEGHGVEVLWRIPTEWRRFENELMLS